MSDQTMKELMEQYDVKTLREGDTIKGTVLSVSDSEVYININYFKDAKMTKAETSYKKEFDLKEEIKVGDEIKAIIVSLEDGDGNVLLSKRKLDVKNTWKKLNKEFDNKNTITLTISEVVKGGVISNYEGVRIFMPGSQVSRIKGTDLNKLVGTEVEARIIEFDRKKGKVVVSKRVLEEEAYAIKKQKEKEAREAEKAARWNSINEGEKREGTVTKVLNKGVIVKVNGIEGYIPAKDLSWERHVTPANIVKEGDNVEVYVTTVDRENEKLYLALKDVNNNPWDSVTETVKVNSVMEGKVTKFINAGAFVEVVPGVEGLVHITEITDENIAKAEDVLKLGQKVKVKVLEVHPESKRISLSIKDASEKSKEYLKYNDEFEGSALGDLFGDKLKDIF